MYGCTLYPVLQILQESVWHIRGVHVWALARRSDAYKADGTSPNWVALSRELTVLRRAGRRGVRLGLARLHARIADRRRDALHRATTTIVRAAEVIGIEGLRVKAMSRGTGRRAFRRSVAGAVRNGAPRRQGRTLKKSGFYSFVTMIRNRRFPIVDRQRCLVTSFAFFEHSGALKTIHLTNGMTVPSPIRAPLTLEISELFQIHGGKLDQIEAVINTVPYGMKSAVWDEQHAREARDTNIPADAP